MTTTSVDLVTEAVAALSAFHVTRRRDAARLLIMWARVGELTPGQRREVLGRFTR